MRTLSAKQVLTLQPDTETAQLLRASELNLGEVLALLSVGRDDTTFVHDASGLRFLARREPPGSMVLLTHWPQGDAAEPLIDVELRRFEAFGTRVDWQLFGGAAQADLARRLEQRRLTMSSTPWLMADLEALPAAPAMPPELRIALAETERAMHDWRRAFQVGFGFSEQAARQYHHAYTSQPRASERVQARIHYVAYVGDVPVACAMLLLAAGVACLWDITTAPEHRRKGYAACLTRAALDEARSRGYRCATLNASRLARPLYAAVGFSLECEVPELRWTPELSGAL